MATDPNTLHQYKGHPVPWVARWSGEIVPDPYKVQVVRNKDGYNLKIAYENGDEVREAGGVLWQREGLTRSGVPNFGELSTYRQRASMNRRKCQICGTNITGRITPWIIEPLEGTFPGRQEMIDGEHITSTPPVCDDCIPLALDLCPHLRKFGCQILDVLEYEVWGVFGEVVYWDGEKTGRSQMSIGYFEDYGEKFSYEAVLAKQQIVKFTKFKVRETIKPAIKEKEEE